MMSSRDMKEVEYPTSDGQPMAESPFHARVMVDVFLGLQSRYGALADAWEGMNFFLFYFYEKGNPKARVSPDVMLAKGVARWDRQNYLLWKERPPSLIVEVTSRKTRRKDTGFKKDLYERIGVEEYILFDPWETTCGLSSRDAVCCGGAISPFRYRKMARC